MVGVGVKVSLLGDGCLGLGFFWQRLVRIKVRYYHHWLGWG